MLETICQAQQTHETQEESTDYIYGMCCDCARNMHGFCEDYSENESCKYRKEDGTCWTNPNETHGEAERGNQTDERA